MVSPLRAPLAKGQKCQLFNRPKSSLPVGGVAADAGPGTAGRTVAMATVDAGGRRRGQTQFLVERLDHVDARLQLVGHLAQLFDRAHVLDEDSLLRNITYSQCIAAVVLVGIK